METVHREGWKGIRGFGVGLARSKRRRRDEAATAAVPSRCCTSRERGDEHEREGMHRERVGRVGRRGERHGEEDGRKGGGSGSRSRNLGNRRGVLGFHLQGAECWPRHARVDGVASGWLRTAGFSSVIIAEQQQSDDPTLVYGTLRVGSKSVCELSRQYQGNGARHLGRDVHFVPS